MCGRYTYYSSAEILNHYGLLDTKDPTVQLAMSLYDNYNVTPGSEMPVIIRGSQKHRLELMHWGLIPSWSKNAQSGLKLINARREGLLIKPMWKRLVKRRRCVVPARGFYEWQVHDDKKQPYYIYPAQGTVFNFAGLWDEWHDTRGHKVKSYAIVTTAPNATMSQIHNRMPAILNDVAMDIWLGADELEQSQLDELLSPTPDASLVIQKVSPAVNNTHNHSAELIYPLEENN